MTDHARVTRRPGVVRIGCGAGFADDRIDPAVELVVAGDLDYLVFECLAERTIALAALEKSRDSRLGYNEWLTERMEAVLAECVNRNVKIVTNMGAANPVAAAQVVAEIGRRLGLPGLRIAAVTGDDVLQVVGDAELPLLETPQTMADLRGTIVSANAYLGAEGIVQALALGAQVVITGRVADPSLFIAPLMFEFGWDREDWDLLGKAACAGHLLECAAQVTGGYFADPGVKDVPGIANLGFPIAEVAADGTFVVTKVEGSGGIVSVQTCTEQLLYEVHDPASYISADVVADFSAVEFTQLGPDRVAVRGATGRPRPANLKVSVGYRDGYIGEGQISYAGPQALERARLAIAVLKERLATTADTLVAMQFDLIGLDSVHRGSAVPTASVPDEIRVRAATRSRTEEDARRTGREVVALWLNGPAGGAGARRSIEEVLAIASTFIPRTVVSPHVELLEV